MRSLVTTLSRLTTLAPLVLASASPALSAELWRAKGGVLTFSLEDSHLATQGLSIASVRGAVSPALAPREGSEGTPYSFAIEPARASFETQGGRFVRFTDELEFNMQGGFILRAVDPRTGIASAPAFLYDAKLLPQGSTRVFDVTTLDPALPIPLEVHDAGATFDAERGELVFLLGDLRVSEAWAASLGNRVLPGQWIGSIDLRLTAELVRTDGLAPEERPNVRGGVLDVLLGELWGISTHGRLGPYPTGVNGLSAATTSCNNGSVNVPWNQAMAETHPFIGLALFRLKDGVLEQVGKNWAKHGWYALASNQCFLGCVGGGGNYLAVGCSDTYSASNNAERYWLGPRSEINPWTGSWTAWGSFFDAIPVNGLRNYFGAEPNEVNHRLEVWDEDLGNLNEDLTYARYFYEGVYFVADDDTLSNNIGYRECIGLWTGSSWGFTTLGGGLAPIEGPVVLSWGDQQDVERVAPDDGEVMLAVQVEDLGGGQWHYEYALYNRTADRGVRAFSVPVGSSTISNIGFHDVDKNSANDWSASVADGAISWATADFATDPNAPMLPYQTMFNFRFDADAPPVSASARGEIFKPGIGTTFFLDTQAPATTTSALAQNGAAANFSLSANEPNPFRESTRVRFTLAKETKISLSVLDVAGRTVQRIFAGVAPAGSSSVVWNGRDERGRPVGSGLYFIRLETEEGARTRKALLLN
jgi:hypothetical protein